jgi:Uncharacterized protein conserved in archaea
LSLRVEEEHYIPYQMVLNYLKEEKEVSEVKVKIRELLQKIVKCDHEKAISLFNELKKFNLREQTVAQIVSICPTSVGELLPLMSFEQKVPNEEVLKEIVEVVKKYITS